VGFVITWKPLSEILKLRTNVIWIILSSCMWNLATFRRNVLHPPPGFKSELSDIGNAIKRTINPVARRISICRLLSYSTFLRNVGKLVPGYMASLSTAEYSSLSDLKQCNKINTSVWAADSYSVSSHVELEISSTYSENLATTSCPGLCPVSAWRRLRGYKTKHCFSFSFPVNWK
jgi:hypothetical protein